MTSEGGHKTPTSTLKELKAPAAEQAETAYNNCCLGSPIVKALWEGGKEKAIVEESSLNLH